MLRVGAHVSIAGGVGSAVGRQKAVGGNCGQIFVSSPRMWAVKEPPEDEIKRFRVLRQGEDQFPYAVHSKYLINLGAGSDPVIERSISTLQRELDVAHALGIEYLVLHPGAHTGGIDRPHGIRKVGDSLASVSVEAGVKILLENTSGGGTTLGRTFQELREMMDGSGLGFDKIGICFDTCHGFCAGYGIHKEDGLLSMIEELDNEIGLKNLCLMHLNDSKHPFDSRRDEHQHIGEGHIGDEGFRALLTNESLKDVPKVLETPVTKERGYEWNIRKVIKLAH